MSQPRASVREVRLQAERALLEKLVRCNGERLGDLVWRDTTLWVSIRKSPALVIGPGGAHESVSEHRVRIEFPRHFPALPMEAYLSTPVFHPNIHPETGFVCLWRRHSVTHTVEHALHKTVAMLAWRLFTREDLHCMQISARAMCESPEHLDHLQTMLAAEPLLGVEHPQGYIADAPTNSHRRRLS